MLRGLAVLMILAGALFCGTGFAQGLPDLGPPGGGIPGGPDLGGVNPTDPSVTPDEGATDPSQLSEDLTCPDANFWSGDLASNICWECIMPIRIAGFAFGRDGDDDVPDDAASMMCVCPGKTFGYPSYGLTIGWWEPTHSIEMVRQPWCSPVMGQVLQDTKKEGTGGEEVETDDGKKTKLGISIFGRWGGYNNGGESGKGSSYHSYYNFHWWVFPAQYIMNSIMGSYCQGKAGGMDMDILYISEIDASWIDDELALYTSMETALFANPIAIGACMGDSVASTVDKPIAELYWCAGSWGHAFPYSGNIPQSGSPPRESSLGAFKGLSKMHRYMLAKRTYGDDAVCSNQYEYTIPKQQYRFETFWPMAETDDTHWLGASTFNWGEWRNIPVKGEDYVYMQWNWIDCCATFW